MSYTVVADRRFIRTSKGIIPLMLVGDSSLRSNTGKIVLEWTIMDQALSNLPAEEALKNVARTAEERADREAFMWRGKFLPYTKLYGWFKKGCSEARTLEEYLVANHRQHGLDCSVLCYAAGASFGRHTNLKRCTTTQELDKWLESAMAEVKAINALGAGTQDSKPRAYLCVKFTSAEPLAATVRSDDAVVVKYGRNEYVERYITGKSLKFTNVIEDAAVFDSIVAAQDAIGDCWEGLHFVKAPKPGQNCIVLKILDAFGKESFICSSQSYDKRVKRTTDPKTARRFRTVSTAKTAGERLWSKGYLWKEISCYNFITGDSVVIAKKEI